MKTNVGVELTDEQRSHLADLLDGRHTKRLITRAEVCAMVQGSIDAALAQFGAEAPKAEPAAKPRHENATRFVAQIEDGLDRRGWRGTAHEKGYRRGWELPAFQR